MFLGAYSLICHLYASSIADIDLRAVERLRLASKTTCTVEKAIARMRMLELLCGNAHSVRRGASSA